MNVVQSPRKPERLEPRIRVQCHIPDEKGNGELAHKMKAIDSVLLVTLGAEPADDLITRTPPFSEDYFANGSSSFRVFR